MENRIKELVALLNKASDAYYNGKNEIMSNYEWDQKFDELKKLEEETGIVLPDSPTNSVGSDTNNKGKKVTHEFPALSLPKSKDIDDIKKWAGERPVWVSYKLDGCTIVATYDGGKLTTLATRGNGTIGQDITHLASSISGIPLKIDHKGHLVVRGECLISYSDFDNFNTDDLYANPRNLVAGSLSLDDVKEADRRNMHLKVFNVVHIDIPMQPWGDRMHFVYALGFDTVESKLCLTSDIEEVFEEFTQHVKSEGKDKYPYPVDGLVVCFDDTDYAKSGNITGHHETLGGMAFKWADTTAETILKNIEWSPGVHQLTPVAVFEPVQLEGTTVQRASLSNVTELDRIGIGGPGSKLSVYKANMIIPKVESCTEKVGEFEIPDTCPVCGSTTKVVISDSGIKTLVCTLDICPGKQLNKFARFVSKDGMDIVGLSKESIRTFMSQGIISRFTDIYDIPTLYKGKIAALEGYGQKAEANIISAIHKSQVVDAKNFLYALCIPNLGHHASKLIIEKMGIDGFIKNRNDAEAFTAIDGIGPVIAESIVDWWQSFENQRDFEDLRDLITVINGEPKKDEGGKCAGLTFVITGKVFQFKNRDEFKVYVESEGGKVAGSVSSKTNYLVNNDVTSTSGKNKKAQELNIPIISEDTFLELFGK